MNEVSRESAERINSSDLFCLHDLNSSGFQRLQILNVSWGVESLARLEKKSMGLEKKRMAVYLTLKLSLGGQVEARQKAL